MSGNHWPSWLLLLGLVGCGNGLVGTDGTAAARNARLTPEARMLLEEIESLPVDDIQPVYWKRFRAGDAGETAKRDANNRLWIKLYEAVASGEGTCYVRNRGHTPEAAPVATYYLVESGKLRIVTDYSRDPYGDYQVIVDRPQSFSIGYFDYFQPCPCKSGKAIVDCCIGKSSSPLEFVVVKEDFPKDQILEPRH
jgi:hypothetical protein